ncbi:hypothetical protein [Lysinibacillus sp. Bpr_S20]|uniref:phage tail assembly chaperone n=1 Tax=Lysinibacillus sp. Bpr_S20 TaxID=2933964 RepID=UPI002011F3A1|nr:hypothetical protein [Lysinibacillus sp. Bpr_S20]MCL1701627.1 hypothetical protein [Lysinibacillus sp. Bpr_S20]
MNDKNLDKEELLEMEPAIIDGLLRAYEDNKEETREIVISRKGKALFTFNVQPVSEEKYDEIQDKATKFKNNKAGIKVPVETDYPKMRAMLIYEATKKEDRARLWDNKKYWDATGSLTGTHLVEKVLRAGEKSAVVQVIDEISGYMLEAEDMLKNSSEQEEE